MSVYSIRHVRVRGRFSVSVSVSEYTLVSRVHTRTTRIAIVRAQTARWASWLALTVAETGVWADEPGVNQ